MKKRTYLISLSLAAGLALSQLTGCASSGPEETTAAESTQAPSEAETASIPNPMEEVENEQSFESMGIHMVAPADGENTKFYTISGEVAEITFDENGVSYCYRASNTAEDFAGIFERFNRPGTGCKLGVWQNSRTGPGKDHRKRRKTGFMVLGQHTLYRIHCLCHFRRRVYPGGYQFNGIKLSRIMDLG